MANIIEAFVAFDTSKLRNAVAIAEAGRAGEVRFLGEIENTEAAIVKLVRKLAAKYGRLTFCYEAGPTGSYCRPAQRIGFTSLPHRASSNQLAALLGPKLTAVAEHPSCSGELVIGNPADRSCQCGAAHRYQ